MCVIIVIGSIITWRRPILLRQSREALASRKYITIELEDGLPAALRDVHGPNQDDLVFRDPSRATADPPTWLLTVKSLGLL
jgi:hypothetical protein